MLTKPSKMTKRERAQIAKEIDAGVKTMNSTAHKQQAFVQADWNDPEGLAKSFQRACTALGISVREDPRCAGTSTIGYILTRK